jgi:hypothetical protein
MAANLLLLLAVSLAWAAGYLFVGAVDHGAPPITATAAMCLLAAAAMLPAVAFAPGRRLLQPLRRRPWVPVVMGLTAVALPNLAVVAAERSVTPAQAAVLGTTVPIATLLLGALLGSRAARLTPLRVLGVAVALAGMVIFVGWNELAANVAEIAAIPRVKLQCAGQSPDRPLSGDPGVICLTCSRRTVKGRFFSGAGPRAKLLDVPGIRGAVRGAHEARNSPEGGGRRTREI